MLSHWRKSSFTAETIGLFYGFLGVLSFSLTLPATRVAVAALDPIFIGLGRGVVAGTISALILWRTHQPLPKGKQWHSLVIVSIGVVLGFPLLSAWAMQRLPAAHGAVVLGLLPLMTAIAGVLRSGERPSRLFWIASAVGSGTVVGFAVSSGAQGLHLEDLVLLGAVIAAAFGYAEGGKLAQTLGGWQVICWALVLAAPFETVPTLWIADHQSLTSPVAWIGFAYLCLVSQLIGFFAWYHGLAIGGVARVSQMQLLQPFLTILFSAVLLKETITFATIAAATLVIGSVAIGRKAKIQRIDSLESQQ
jgi:drug/metabolite transporter (DMT)-like permease